MDFPAGISMDKAMGRKARAKRKDTKKSEFSQTESRQRDRAIVKLLNKVIDEEGREWCGNEIADLARTFRDRRYLDLTPKARDSMLTALRPRFPSQCAAWTD